MKKKTKRHLNKGTKKHLLLTALVGVVFWLIGELLFPLLTERLWTPLGISLYFLIFAVLMLITFFLLLASKADISQKESRRNIKESNAIGAIIMVVVIVFSCLFEFLYELGGRDYLEPTSYIFLVDDSGSMDGTEDIRVQAIQEVMSNSDNDKPYAVYKFSHDAELIKPMRKYSKNDAHNWTFESLGGTEILGSIRTVVDDFKNGALTGAGISPKILLISDGSSSTFGSKSVARLCKKNGISVSTIGVEGCNEIFLKQFADSTGGVFVSCNDVSKLAESLEQAKAMNTERNLLSTRFVYQDDGLYAFLRILFLVLLGVAWSFGKMYLSYNSNNVLKRCVIISIACCAAAALIMELLSGTFINIRILRLVFCVLWAITYGEISPKRKRSEAQYGDATSVQGGPFAEGDIENEDKLKADAKKDDSVKTLGFEETGQADPNGTTPVDNPFGAGNTNLSYDPFSRNLFNKSDAEANGNFTSNPFGGQNPSSSPFANDGSNPFDNNSSSSNPFV